MKRESGSGASDHRHSGRRESGDPESSSKHRTSLWIPGSSAFAQALGGRPGMTDYSDGG
jgi:hypothetical protein